MMGECCSCLAGIHAIQPMYTIQQAEYYAIATEQAAQPKCALLSAILPGMSLGVLRDMVFLGQRSVCGSLAILVS